LIAIDAFRRIGINVAKLCADLQTEGAKYLSVNNILMVE